MCDANSTPSSHQAKKSVHLWKVAGTTKWRFQLTGNLDFCDMDTVSSKKRSEIMSRVRSKDSKIEVSFRKELWKRGFRYRKNPSKHFGKPDIVLKKYRAVIFIDSCFWHGCERHCRVPSTRTAYWKQKIHRNIARDKEVTMHYREIDWKIFRIWEHQLGENMDKTLGKLLWKIYS